jgi:hypothetical protein
MVLFFETKPDPLLVFPVNAACSRDAVHLGFMVLELFFEPSGEESGFSSEMELTG